MPRKNIRPFLGTPMLEHVIATAVQSGLFDEVHVSTEDSEILELAASAGVRPRFRRPKHLGNNEVSIREVVLDVVQSFVRDDLVFEEVAVLSATAALATPELLQRSYSHFQLNRLVPTLAVIRQSTPVPKSLELIGETLRPFDQSGTEKHSQDVDPTFADANIVTWFSLDYCLGSRFLQDRVWRPFEVVPWRGVDIDTEEDWKLAEILAAGIASLESEGFLIE